ncbi:YitT family protein [Tissierella pigra]|uniref:YitT family protein n=1 Tax=Tissierella pigra TaxID=2607614 RepID=A0A6N7XHA8_9FIRM|nr:YitT family protein [Tissierella pigra]MBU5427316.1 YitT family protein [Tissierella pigra]MSU01431.1 YitT family protein [Tissierella pigra]
MKINFKKFMLINFGVFIMALGLYYFLLPENLAVGGAIGIAMVINNIFKFIPIGIIMGIVNIFLFILAFLVIGKDFGGYTIYSSFLLSGIIYLLEIITPLESPIIDDLTINLIYGIIIQGIGMAIIFSQNASTGGTDIIAKIINKFTHLNIGKALLLSDFIIIVFATFSFGLKLGLYALLGLIINAYVIDNMIASFNERLNVIIISDKSNEINDYIINEIKRGTTIYVANGGFSRSEKTIISTVVGKRQYIRIKNYAQGIDSNVFITMGLVNEVLGEGFSFD